MKRLITSLGLGFAMSGIFSTPAQACAVCFGAPGSDVNKAMALAIGFMLLILAVVLGSFITFFFYLKRRAQMVATDPTTSLPKT